MSGLWGRERRSAKADEAWRNLAGAQPEDLFASDPEVAMVSRTRPSLVSVIRMIGWE
jgi:hypothetical protein